MGKILDLSGRRFERLTVLSIHPDRNSSNKVRWICLCDCGKYTVVNSGSLTSGNTTSCGCVKDGSQRIINLTGKKFGRLTVVSIDTERTSSGQLKWVCKCECGNAVSICGQSLRESATLSCGCYHSDELTSRNTKHGMSYSPEYNTWLNIKDRCTKPSCDKYQFYGGRGIEVCERWLSFDNFFSGMGLRPSAKHSIERRDNNGNYEPNNCVWATKPEQDRNKRSNRWIEYNGKRMIAKDWSDLIGIKSARFRYLLKTKSIEQILDMYKKNSHN
jgi:hypothetical protein